MAKSKQQNQNTDLQIAESISSDKPEKVWDGSKEQLLQLKEMVAEDATWAEFQNLVGMGKSLGANPFTREIYLVKYGKNAQIFCGRDFYRRKAQEQPDYRGHHVDVVYTTDKFTKKSGPNSPVEPEHEYSAVDRLQEESKIMGAYCVVYKEDTRDFYHFVKFKEYYDGRRDLSTGKIKTDSYGNPRKRNVWDNKPETMIKKVAEAQCLRMAYQGIFKGTYHESEAWDEQGSFVERDDQGGVEVRQKPEGKQSLADSLEVNSEDIPEANEVTEDKPGEPEQDQEENDSDPEETVEDETPFDYNTEQPDAKSG